MSQLDSGVPARDVLQCACACRLALLRYALRRAGEDHLDVQGRLGCTRLVMAPQPSSTNNGTLQSDVDIPGERDQRYGTLPLKCSDDGDYGVITMYFFIVY